MAANVITFLPYADFVKSAQVLDNARLGKQRSEARQLLDTVRGRSDAWAHHPAAQMWADNAHLLCCYGIEVCVEWRRRGFRDAVMDELLVALMLLEPRPAPWWLGDERLHSSHRANLVRKDIGHYKFTVGFTEAPADGYWWPTKEAM